MVLMDLSSFAFALGLIHASSLTSKLNEIMAVQQTLPNIYLDSEKLKDFLLATFGKGNFRMQVREGEVHTGARLIFHSSRPTSGQLLLLASSPQ